MTTPEPIGLPPELFSAAFPFHFAFDANLVVQQVGHSLPRLCPNLLLGQRFDEYFNIVFPTNAGSFDALRQGTGSLFILELPDRNVRLRGQMVYLPEGELIVFLGSPWLTDPGEMKRLGLTLSDFALHDPVVDLLQVMQNQALALADTRKLADRLAAQRSELQIANVALKTEIADRLAAEAELSEREARFQTLVEAASEAIIIVDDRGHIVLINARAEELFGYTRDELIDQPIEVLIPDEWRMRHVQHRIDYMQQPRTRPMGGGLILTGKNKAGSQLPLEISLSTIETQGGMLVMCFVTDITERRRVAEELKSQRDFALQIMSSMGQGLSVTDRSGQCEYANQAFARMVGHPPGALIGRSLAEFIVPEDRDRFARTHALLQAGHTTNEEVRLLHAMGDPVHVLFTCVPRLRDGKYQGSITVITDLAERKQIEQALEWARDRALEASRVKSDFLANMSHEIRTPLNSIIGVAEMLAATPLNDQQREFAHIIFESGKALLALISDILDFSKIEAGKLLIEQHPFELNRCIESALDQVSTTAQEKGLELAYLIEEPVPHQVVGDETRLRQILINLLGNAAKFTQHGEVTLTVSAHMLEDPSDTYELLFVVHDSGIGIPPERQERLFQSFSQVDASTTRKYGGTGLGLAISQRLCEAMGGQMWVESVGIAGKGTDFCFTLPLAEALLVPPAIHDAGDVLRNKHLVLVLGNCGAAVQWRSLAVQAQLWAMEARFCSSLDELAAWRAAGKPVDVAVIDQQSVSAIHELAGADVPELAGLRWLILAPLGHREPVSGINIAGYVSKPVKSAQWKHALMQALDGTSRPVNARPELENLFDPGFAQHIPRHILVVEDNPVNQIVIRRLLERLGYATDIADCGQNALTAIHERAYDLIFMDMQMPDMDGLETSRRIRQLERTAKPARPQATIVALTANVQPEYRAACLAAGMDDYVSKPIQITELCQVIARTAHKSAVIRQ